MKNSGRIHPSTAIAARQYARESLGMRHPKLRPPTKDEAKQARAYVLTHAECSTEAVVVRDAKDHFETLMLVDTDVAHSCSHKRKSALLTLLGLVPIVGKIGVLGHAAWDIAMGGGHAVADKFRGNKPAPEDHALIQTGLKHVGVTMASIATGGLPHMVVLAGEVSLAIDDLRRGDPQGNAAKGAAAAVLGMLKTKEPPPEAASRRRDLEKKFGRERRHQKDVSAVCIDFKPRGLDL